MAIKAPGGKGIDQLEKAGLVGRRQSGDDRRSFLISLTDKGSRVIDAAVTAQVNAQARLVSGLFERDQRQLDALLKAFLAGTEKK
jgi:DNA-binding MarR family transcriptional regulator